MKRVKLNFLDNPEDLDQLPVSKYFLGNLWRLEALCQLYEARKKSRLISQKELEDIIEMLYRAITQYKLSKCPKTQKGSLWGLGLTYNFLGRMYTYKSIENIQKAKDFY